MYTNDAIAGLDELDTKILKIIEHRDMQNGYILPCSFGRKTEYIKNARSQSP